MSESKRFVQLGDTHIKDTLTGEEWYAPCETSLFGLLNEQQATIKKLQDLCGESDSENAKLRIENKRLQEENEQLQTQLTICQQSKNDDCRFKVWKVPPIRRGMRVSTTTIDDEQKKDSKRWRWSE